MEGGRVEELAGMSRVGDIDREEGKCMMTGMYDYGNADEDVCVERILSTI